VQQHGGEVGAQQVEPWTEGVAEAVLGGEDEGAERGEGPAARKALAARAGGSQGGGDPALALARVAFEQRQLAARQVGAPEEGDHLRLDVGRAAHPRGAAPGHRRRGGQGNRLTAGPERRGRQLLELGADRGGRAALSLSLRDPLRDVALLGQARQLEHPHRRRGAGEIAAYGLGMLPPRQVVVREDHHPGAAQRRAVGRPPLTGAAGAGAGKTTAAATIADAYRDAGYEVVGGALAGKAADTLQQEARIHSRTLHSWEYSWGRGEETLDRRIVLVIDEAGMVDARQLSRVLDHAATHDAKVILLGDPDQLKPIGPGDAYRGLLEQHAPARLETIRRQAEPWQREASEDLAGGRVAPALDAYQQAGRLHIADTRDAARAELLTQYAVDRAAEPGRGQLVLAYRNDDVARLNTGIRDQRLAAGELRGHVTVAGANYAAGDRLVFLKNDHQGREVSNLGRGKRQAIGVKNGTLATLEKVSPDRFVARLDDGRRVAFSPDQYNHIAHGYAVTIHKSQGATVDRTYVLADPMMNRNASYVALTRHREGVHVYTDRATFADREQLDSALSRAPAKDLARDYAAAAIERHAARLAPLADQARSLNNEWQEIARVAATIENASTTARQLGEAHDLLVREARRVYRDPPQAIERLTADPRALERLSAGEAATYGQLKGRGGNPLPPARSGPPGG